MLRRFLEFTRDGALYLGRFLPALGVAAKAQYLSHAVSEPRCLLEVEFGQIGRAHV